MKKNKINRDFGILIFTIFLILSIYPYFKNGEDINIIFLILALTFGFLGILNSTILIPFTMLWLKIGQKLSIFFSPIILSILYFVLIIPVGLLIKIFKKNYLNIKIDKKAESYWEKKDSYKTSMDNEF